MISEPSFYAAALLAVFLAGFGKGFGGTLGMLAVPVMALTIPPMQAATILLPILLFMDVVSLTAWRGVYDRMSLLVLLPGTVIGTGLAWLTAAQVDESTVRLLVGVVALVFALNYFRKRGRVEAAQPHNAPKGVVLGTIAGFTSFITHAGAPPFQMYMLPLKLDPPSLVGTSVIFFAVGNLLKVVPYFALGQFSGENLATSLLLLPFAGICTIAGYKAVHRIDGSRFYAITYAIMLVVAAKLIWDGLASLGWH